jgi:predicted acetyltransferase
MISLERPSEKHKESFLAACQEYAAHGMREGMAGRPAREFETYIENLNNGLVLKPGYVPASMYWIVNAEGYVGRITIRHRLTEELKRVGGHIGYVVRPSKRGQGYASEALRMALKEAKLLGLAQVLLTCDDDNTASIRVIEKNGGVREENPHTNDLERAIRRYWINLE